MVVVSQNQDLYINLDTTIDCKLLCRKIGKFIDNYNKNTVNDGYYCSTFEPILFLLVEYLNITIIHDYNKNIIKYSHKKNNRYTIHIYSNHNHCWS